MADRLSDLRHFYELIDELREVCGSYCSLADAGRPLPLKGVYFFFEAGELRTDTGSGPRVVRVGTHGVSESSKSTLKQRLDQHRGNLHSGRGNHRGSIFRALIGQAIAARDISMHVDSWGRGNTAKGETRKAEDNLEAAVSSYVRAMPFLIVSAIDAPGKNSIRANIESNAIGLLSNFGKTPALDSPSPSWLGRNSNRPKVRDSGLWNSRDVDAGFDSTFLDKFSSLIQAQRLALV